MNKPEQRLPTHVLESIKQAYFDSIQFQGGVFHFAKYHACKETHGDIDVVFEKTEPRLTFLGYLFILMPDAKLDTKNSNCWMVSGTLNGYAVRFDLLLVAEGMLQYYDYGNMSLLIGKSIPRNLKFGFQGLFYRNFNKNHRVQTDEILITSDYKQALRILGYDVSELPDQFPSNRSMLNFVARGKYFQPRLLETPPSNNKKVRREAYRASIREDVTYLLEKTPAADEFPRRILDRYATDLSKLQSKEIGKSYIRDRVRRILKRKGVVHFDVVNDVLNGYVFPNAVPAAKLESYVDKVLSHLYTKYVESEKPHPSFRYIEPLDYLYNTWVGKHPGNYWIRDTDFGLVATMIGAFCDVDCPSTRLPIRRELEFLQTMGECGFQTAQDKIFPGKAWEQLDKSHKSAMLIASAAIAYAWDTEWFERTMEYIQSVHPRLHAFLLTKYPANQE